MLPLSFTVWPADVFSASKGLLLIMTNNKVKNTNRQVTAVIRSCLRDRFLRIFLAKVRFRSTMTPLESAKMVPIPMSSSSPSSSPVGLVIFDHC